MNIKDDFNELRSTAHMMNEQLQILNNLVDTEITTVYGLSNKIRSALEKTHFSKISEMDDEDVTRFLRDNGEQDSNLDAMKKAQEEAKDEWKDVPFHDFCRHVLNNIKDSLMNIKKLERDRDNLANNMKEIEDNYFNYVNTKEYKDKKLNQLEDMKKQAEDETDPVKKAQILRNLEYMHDAETLKFLTDYTDEKGQRAVDNIADVYFNHQRSSLVMKKFAVRMPKFGYNKDIYKFFFNLEENFLPEEYHAFNNLFLFHVMRTISFMDVDSKRDTLYASAILVKLYNLVYHKFGDQAMEDEFIEFIRKFDDLFMENWKEKFERDNVTNPKHPERIKKDEEAEKRRRIMTIAEIKNHGVEPDTSLDTESLVNQLKDIINSEKCATDTELYEWTKAHPDEKEEQSSESENDTKEDLPVAYINNSMDANTLYEEDGSAIPENDTPIIDMEHPEEVMQAINDSKDFDEFDKDVEAIGDELRKEMNRDNPDGVIQEESVEDKTDEDSKWIIPVQNNKSGTMARGKTAAYVEELVYVDPHGYYYRLMPDGTYTYFTDKDLVYETGFTEKTILSLMNTGNLNKMFKQFKIHQ